ncbi:MAG: hypothetical protein KJO11_11895, partial [Gemmatimonadetes bacterium]|nr:hypothetical protein [Gemmatimonadota bacterium]
VLGLLLVRLHMLGAADLLIVGVYFMLSGIARFVEESYRGEPQTPLVAGLRLYQWFGLGTLLVGVALTMVPVVPVVRSVTPPTALGLALGLTFFVVGAAAMGLDFPGSDRRFSRLAAADRLDGPTP